MIPKIEAAIREYRWSRQGDYRAWPGPNSNTFIAAILDAVPGMRAALPSTAIGKDFPYDGRWLRRAPSGTGISLTFGGYAALTIGWFEGIELSLLGLAAGIDLRRPALKLAGLGRLGFRHHSVRGSGEGFQPQGTLARPEIPAEMRSLSRMSHT